MKNLHSITTKEEAIEFLKANVDNNDTVQDCLILIGRFDIPFDEVNKTIASVPEPVRQPRMPKGHSDNRNAPIQAANSMKYIIASNELEVVQLKDVPDKDLIVICKAMANGTVKTQVKYLHELFDRFETYAKVQSLFAKISKRES